MTVYTKYERWTSAPYDNLPIQTRKFNPQKLPSLQKVVFNAYTTKKFLARRAKKLKVNIVELYYNYNLDRLNLYFFITFLYLYLLVAPNFTRPY